MRQKRRFDPNLACTGIGSLPHESPEEALDLIRRTCPEVPYWPQLPRRSSLESMYVQFSTGLPGSVWADGRIVVDVGSPDSRFAEQAAQFYERYMKEAAEEGKTVEGRGEFGPVGANTRQVGTGGQAVPKEAITSAETPSAGWALDESHAAGLRALLREAEATCWPGKALAVKGQIAGPISFGLTVTDENGKALLYRPEVMDVASKYLSMAAAYQERELRNIGTEFTLLFIDEPYMSTYGSGYFFYGRPEVERYVGEVIGALSGLKGIHCCANTDWSVILGLALDIVSFDACDYAEHFLIYSREVGDFLSRGGIIAWGIVPTTEGRLEEETPETAAKRWECAARDLLKEVAKADGKLRDLKALGARSLLTPACGLGGVSVPAAEKAFDVLSGASGLLRKELGISS